jgi:hypothetical protein
MLTYKDFSLLQNTQNGFGALQASCSVGTAYVQSGQNLRLTTDMLPRLRKGGTVFLFPCIPSCGE